MNNKKKINDFTDLETYQLSLDLAKEIYLLTRKLPSDEKFGIINQLKRASASVGANIAEGFGRYHTRDFIKFLYNARGSLNEVYHFLLLSRRLCYISDKDLDKFTIRIKNISVKLNNLINAIANKIKK